MQRRSWSECLRKTAQKIQQCPHRSCWRLPLQKTLTKPRACPCTPAAVVVAAATAAVVVTPVATASAVVRAALGAMPAGSCTQGHLERALAARGLHVPAHRPQGNRTCPDSSTCRLLRQAKSRQPLGRRQKPPRSAANTRWRMRPGSHLPAALPYRSPGTSQRGQAYNTLAEGSPEAVAAAAVGPGWVGTARCRKSAGRRPRGTAARTMGAKRQVSRMVQARGARRFHAAARAWRKECASGSVHTSSGTPLVPGASPSKQ